MDTAVANLRITFVVIVVVAVLFGIYLHQLAQITAGTAAAAAVAAAARTLDDADWDCTDSGPHWQTATEAAAAAATARTSGSSAATATDFSLTADPSCSVIATVTVSAAGARYWLHAQAGACRPTRASFTAGLALPAPC